MSGSPVLRVKSPQPDVSDGEEPCTSKKVCLETLILVKLKLKAYCKLYPKGIKSDSRIMYIYLTIYKTKRYIHIYMNI